MVAAPTDDEFDLWLTPTSLGRASSGIFAGHTIEALTKVTNTAALARVPSKGAVR